MMNDEAQITTVELKQFYATTASNQPDGVGYWEIHAPDKRLARELVHKHTDGRWSFMYDSLDDVHPLDRNRHGVLTYRG